MELARAVQDVVDGLRTRIKDRDATVRFDPAALPTVSADPALLGSILQNLIANSGKFGGEQPRVDVTAERDGDGWWRISVTDRGIGIPPAEQERIFDLFHRLHPRDADAGTGLGLALSQRLVARHGGRIGVRSAPGEGSCFWFTLAASDGA